MWTRNTDTGKWFNQIDALSKDSYDSLKQDLQSVRLYSKCLSGSTYLPINNLNNIYDTLSIDRVGYYITGLGGYPNPAYSSFTIPPITPIALNSSNSNEFYNKYLKEDAFTLKNLFTPTRLINDQLNNYLYVDVITTDVILNIGQTNVNLIIDGVKVIEGHRVLIKNQTTQVTLSSTIDPEVYFSTTELAANYYEIENFVTDITYKYYNTQNGIYTYTNNKLVKTTDLDTYESSYRYSVVAKLGTQNRDKQYHLLRLKNGYYPVSSENQNVEFEEKHNWVLRHRVDYNNIYDENYYDILHHTSQSFYVGVDGRTYSIPARTIAVGGFGVIIDNQDQLTSSATFSQSHIISNKYKVNMNSISDTSLYYWVCGDEGTLLRVSKIDFAIKRIELDETSNFTSISFYNNLNGMVVGKFNTIYWTNDGGDKWSKITYPEFDLYSYNKVVQYDFNKAYVGGEAGVFIEFNYSGGTWLAYKRKVDKQLSLLDEYILVEDINDMFKTSWTKLDSSTFSIDQLSNDFAQSLIFTNQIIDDYNTLQISIDSKYFSDSFFQTSEYLISFSIDLNGDNIYQNSNYGATAGSPLTYDIWQSGTSSTNINFVHTFTPDSIGNLPDGTYTVSFEIYYNYNSTGPIIMPSDYLPCSGSYTITTKNGNLLLICTNNDNVICYDIDGLAQNNDFIYYGFSQSHSDIKTISRFYNSPTVYIGGDQVYSFTISDFLNIGNTATNLSTSTSSTVVDIYANKIFSSKDENSDHPFIYFAGNNDLLKTNNYPSSDYNDLDPTFNSTIKSKLLFLDYDIASKLNFFDGDGQYRLPDSVTFSSYPLISINATASIRLVSTPGPGHYIEYQVVVNGDPITHVLSFTTSMPETVAILTSIVNDVNSYQFVYTADLVVNGTPPNYTSSYIVLTGTPDNSDVISFVTGTCSFTASSFSGGYASSGLSVDSIYGQHNWLDYYKDSEKTFRYYTSMEDTNSVKFSTTFSYNNESIMPTSFTFSSSGISIELSDILPLAPSFLDNKSSRFIAGTISIATGMTSSYDLLLYDYLAIVKRHYGSMTSPNDDQIGDVLHLESDVIDCNMVINNILDDYVVETAWSPLSSGVPNNLIGMSFIDDNTGWVSGSGGIILKTVDGGLTWNTQTSGTVNALYTIQFLDANNGYAGGDSNTLLKTTDGGTTWTSIDPGTWTGKYRSMFFIDVNNGFVGGGNVSSVIRKTTDGGTTWSDSIIGYLGIYGLFFIDINNGWAVDFSGNIYNTQNSGMSWNLQWSVPGTPLNSVFFTDINNGYVSGREVILKTTNGGVSWVTEVNTVLDDFYSKIIFTDANTGWVFGGTISTDNSIILNTTDAGVTWNDHPTYVTDRLTNGAFPSPHIGYSCGLNGTILKYTLIGVYRYLYCYSNFNGNIINNLKSTTNPITISNLNKYKSVDDLTYKFNLHPVSIGYGLTTSNNDIVISANFNNKTSYYNMESTIVSNETKDMLYKESFLDFGYSPTYNILDYLSKINSVFLPTKEFIILPTYIGIPGNNGSSFTPNDIYIDPSVGLQPGTYSTWYRNGTNQIMFGSNLKFYWDSLLINTFIDMTINNSFTLDRLLITKKYYDSNLDGYVMEFHKKLDITSTLGVSSFNLRTRNTLQEISDDLQLLNNIQRTSTNKSVQDPLLFVTLENELKSKFSTDSYLKALVSDVDIRHYVTALIYIDSNNDLAMNVANLERDVIFSITGTLPSSVSGFTNKLAINIPGHNLSVGDFIYVEFNGGVGSSQELNPGYFGYQTVIDISTNNITVTTSKDYGNIPYVTDSGIATFIKKDPFFNYQPIDIFDLGSDQKVTRSVEVRPENTKLDGYTYSIVNLDLTKYKFQFVDGLSLDEVNRSFPWLLEAEISDAIIGRDTNGPIWYSGIWRCGRWFGGTWLSGKWLGGDWYGGTWSSYNTQYKVTSVQVDTSYVDNTTSKWFGGRWFDGTWNGGTWYSGRRYDGDWKQGNWYNGIWNDGHWYSGNFEGGIWVQGTWDSGIFNCNSKPSYWIYGSFNSGDFENGMWYNGQFGNTNNIQSRFGTKSTNSRTSTWHGGNWLYGEFHSYLNTNSQTGSPDVSDIHKYSIWKTGNWHNGDFYGGIAFDINFRKGIWHGGILEEIQVIGVNSILPATYSTNSIVINGIFKFNIGDEIWIIDDDTNGAYASLGSNTTPMKYRINKIVEDSTVSQTTLSLNYDLSKLGVTSSVASATYSNYETGLRVVSYFKDSNWQSGIWTNGIFDGGQFDSGIWYNGVFIQGQWGN